MREIVSAPVHPRFLQQLKQQGAILGGFAALLWAIQIVNALTGGALIQFGVHPRTLAGLWGILFAPFIHGSFAHLIANTVPLLVLGWFVMIPRRRDLFIVSACSALVGGLGTWLIAPALSVHVGASVLIFGYLGYLTLRGLLARRFWPLVASAIVLFLYGGAIAGVLPGAVGVSWQGHLFGLLGGLLAARLLHGRGAVPTAARPAPALRAPSPRARIDVARDAAVEAELDAELEQMREEAKLRPARRLG